MVNIITESKKTISLSRIIIVTIVTLYMIYYLITLSDWHFIDNVNLIFHEAGHVVFIFFGDFIRTLGGTLMQLLIPIFCSLYFYREGNNFNAALLLFWVSQNLFNISVYVSDAIKMELPLLGGDGVYHDWNSLLSSINLLNHTDKVASLFYFTGIIILVFAITYSVKLSFKYSLSFK